MWQRDLCRAALPERGGGGRRSDRRSRRRRCVRDRQLPGLAAQPLPPQPCVRPEPCDAERQGVVRGARRMSALRAFGREDGGATIVEFALVTPVLILLLVACLDLA